MTTTTRNFPEKAKTILKGLGFQITDNTVTAPFRRGPEDINIPEDITEEVARIRGYEHIENTPAKIEIKNQNFDGMVQNMRITEQTLVEKCRATQVETYPRVSEKMLQGFGKKADEYMQLQNPVNPECPLLRDSFIYQFIQNATKNAKFFDEINIFDTGKIRNAAPLRKGGAEGGGFDEEQYAKAHLDEQTHTGILLYKKSINNRNQDTLLEAKGIVQTLLHALGLYDEISYQATQFPYFHPKKQGKIIYKGTEIWIIWSFHPLILKNNKLPENANTCFVELYQNTMEELKKEVEEITHNYETTQDQIIRRDLCFVLDIDKDYSELLNRIQSLPEIKEVKVFDLYQWTNLPEGKKSISIQIKLLGDGNMTTEQINEIMNKAIKKAESVGAELRE